MADFMKEAEKIIKDVSNKHKTDVDALIKKYPEAEWSVFVSRTTKKPAILITLPEGSTADISGLPATLGKDGIPVRIVYENRKHNDLSDFFNKHADKVTKIVKAHPGATFGPRWDSETNTPYIAIIMPESSKQDTSDIPSTVGKKKIPVKVEAWRPSACPLPDRKLKP
jgi:hypothetical protein